MFLGHFEHTIDEKGRITIPAKFRELLGDTIVLTLGFGCYLQAYPLDTFNQVAEEIQKTSFFGSNGRSLRRTFFSYAEKLDFDKAGRILISAFLRETATLKDMAVLVGNGEYFELWSPENWQSREKETRDIEANEQRLSTLDLPTLQ